MLEILAGCDLIACEDTRVTGKLLRHFGISKKTVSYNEHNANVSGPKLLREIGDGKAVALVLDAGTPIISDPGFRLVEEAVKRRINVVPLPGASAPLAALVASGLSPETWTFGGFLPNKQGARIDRLAVLSKLPLTLIFFESPNRLKKTLADMVAVFGPDRCATIAREITKIHEEVTTAPLASLDEEFRSREIRGEIVIVISPPEPEMHTDEETLLKELLETMSVSKAAAEAAQLTGGSKRDLYQKALSLKGKREQEPQD